MSILDLLGLLIILILIPLSAYLALDFVREGISEAHHSRHLEKQTSSLEEEEENSER